MPPAASPRCRAAVAVDVARDIGDEDDDGANGRDKRVCVCVCVCGRGCGRGCRRENTLSIHGRGPQDEGRAPTDMGDRPHPPKAWTMGISRHAMGNWMGTRRVSRDSMGCFFFSLAPSALSRVPPPKLPLFGRPGFGRVSRCPAAARGGGDISLFFFLRFFCSAFFFCFSCQVESPMRGRRDGREGGPAWGETAQMQVKRFLGGHMSH